jgi:hypothetical protein
MPIGTLTPSLTETAEERMLDLREWVGVAGVVEEGDREGLADCCTDGGPLAHALEDGEGFWVATEEDLFIG